MIDREGLLRRLEAMVEPGFAAEFLGRLGDSYFSKEDDETAFNDAVSLFELPFPGPPKLRTGRTNKGEIECTVYAFDFPGLFSLITGLLAVSEFDIRTGTVYTFGPEHETARYRVRNRGHYKTVERSIEKPRLIIDRFVGVLRGDSGPASWLEHISALIDSTWNQLRVTDFREISGIDSARRFVYEKVSHSLSASQIEAGALYPISVEVDSTPEGGSKLTVVSQDTPFFLFALGSAVALQSLSIEAVHITTEGEVATDVIEIRSDGEPLGQRMQHIRLLILMTKQFTYFLERAPDPYAALLRFESLCQEIVDRSSRDALQHLLSNPDVLTDLARILGASDFIWEEFVRLQYESLLPMLENSADGQLSRTEEQVYQDISRLLESAASMEEKKRILNDFKNREIYLIDLDHITHPERDFAFLSRQLTHLAEAVVSSAVGIAYDELASRYGSPLGFAGLPTPFAVFGLGKLGGAALGYASDIELLFVYSDTGVTGGATSIRNAEFFDHCVRMATNMIETKQEGIFHIDLRLRPHGSADPLAASLESFFEYYGVGGAAHAYERLSLVRMRRFGGDEAFGRRVERLRDELVYQSDTIDPAELQNLRERQLKEKTDPHRLNAKFSPGALVDLEYTVQLIQTRFGRENPRLRTPRIHAALAELAAAGQLDDAEATQIVAAYDFLRRLINGLRMLRGSAKDLFLPEQESAEYDHLARRMGYPDGEISAGERLYYEFESRTAIVRHFAETRLGRDSIPGVSNIADLVLSESMSPEIAESIINSAGLRQSDRALKILRTMRGDGEKRSVFARLSVLVWDTLRRLPDPDMALNNWERFSSSLPDTLIRSPAMLEWVAEPNLLHGIRQRAALARDIDELSKRASSDAEWKEAIRWVRQREILRIGTRDICLAAPIEDIVEELTIVADACIGAAVSRAVAHVAADISKSGFCVYAFGKLGGRELNYSSDVDLLASYSRLPPERTSEELETTLTAIVDSVRSVLSDHTGTGFAYRVDLRLRPYGRSGTLVPSESMLEEYYASHAASWEHQALIKLRPVAGDIKAGEALVERLHAIAFSKPRGKAVREGIREMRTRGVKRHNSAPRGADVKNGVGGIRDVEFLIQGLQLEPADAEVIREDYLYLRRVEHYLQLLENRQIHSIPGPIEEIETLARRLHGHRAEARDLETALKLTAVRVRTQFERYVSPAEDLEAE